MKKLIMSLAVAAVVLPAVASAQNAPDGRDDGRAEEREDGRNDHFVVPFGRIVGVPGGRPNANGGDVLPEDLINEICEDGDVIIIYGDDGAIEDWDCDFS